MSVLPKMNAEEVVPVAVVNAVELARPKGDVELGAEPKTNAELLLGVVDTVSVVVVTGFKLPNNDGVVGAELSDGNEKAGLSVPFDVVCGVGAWNNEEDGVVDMVVVAKLKLT